MDNTNENQVGLNPTSWPVWGQIAAVVALLTTIAGGSYYLFFSGSSEDNPNDDNTEQVGGAEKNDDGAGNPNTPAPGDKKKTPTQGGWHFSALSLSKMGEHLAYASNIGAQCLDVPNQNHRWWGVCL